MTTIYIVPLLPWCEECGEDLNTDGECPHCDREEPDYEWLAEVAADAARYRQEMGWS